MKKNIISLFVLVFFVTSYVRAISFDPHELQILFKEDPSCYLALKRQNDHALKSIFAFDRSHLAYITTIIQQALLEHKDITIALEKVPIISYREPGVERLYNNRFLYVTYPDIQQIISILE